MFDTSPFMNHLNVSLVEAGAGYLKAELTASDDLRSVRGGRALQGGVVASLADGIAGAAVGAMVDGLTPTIDIRVDYLRPATTDLRAEAEVSDLGESVGRADVEVYDTDDELVARARGVYKIGDAPDRSPWTEEG